MNNGFQKVTERKLNQKLHLNTKLNLELTSDLKRCFKHFTLRHEWCGEGKVAIFITLSYFSFFFGGRGDELSLS